jgi:AraC-like DNA-binding protein
MPNPASRRLEKSAARGGIREQHVAVPSALAHHVASIVVLDAAAPCILLPHVHTHLLVRRDPDAGVVATITGPLTRLHRKSFSSNRAVRVRFRPGTTARVLREATSQFTDAAVPLAVVTGRAAAPLVDELAACWDELPAALDVVARWLARHFVPCAPDVDAAIVTAVAALDREPALRVAELARRLELSERQLRRRFATAVGVSPKTYARVARVHRVLELARDGYAARWADVAVAAGYYDQPHMIDDFRAVTGETPAVLVAELARAMPV